MEYLLTSVDTYRMGTVAEVEAFHQKMLDNPNFTLIAFSYKTKYIKVKGEIVEEYQVVTVKKVFNDEKEPERLVDVSYEG